MAQTNCPADDHRSVEDCDPPPPTTSRPRPQNPADRPLELAGLTRGGVSPSDEEPASQVTGSVSYPLAGQSL